MSTTGAWIAAIVGFVITGVLLARHDRRKNERHERARAGNRRRLLEELERIDREAE